MARPTATVRHHLAGALLAACGALALALAAAPALGADDYAANPSLFTTKVWPIIDSTCTSCHGADKQKGKLRLDSRAAWLKGGEDGDIVVVGDPDKSLVVDAIKYQAKDEDQNMPPKKKNKRLTPEQIQIISDWIKAGMPWPDAK